MFDSILEQVRLFDEKNNVASTELSPIAEAVHEYINGEDILENACLMAFTPSVVFNAEFAENAETNQEQVEDVLAELGESDYKNDEFDDVDYEEDDDVDYEEDDESLEESTNLTIGLTIFKDALSEETIDIAEDANADDEEYDEEELDDEDLADSLIPGLLSDDDDESVVDDEDSASNDYDDDGVYSF